MFCAACVGTVEEAIKVLPGVESASVQLLMETADVKYDSSKTTGTVHCVFWLVVTIPFFVCVPSRGHRRCNIRNRSLVSCFHLLEIALAEVCVSS
jgi:copper chaperone CopZ